MWQCMRGRCRQHELLRWYDQRGSVRGVKTVVQETAEDSSEEGLWKMTEPDAAGQQEEGVAEFHQWNNQGEKWKRIPENASRRYW